LVSPIGKNNNRVLGQLLGKEEVLVQGLSGSFLSLSMDSEIR
jgi:hypothetical protein